MARAGTPERTPLRGLAGWVLFDWAAQPFYTLILTFLFAPYFANTFIGDAVRGQTLWGVTTAAAGVLVAVLSPVLGAVADASGRRKAWIAVFSLALVTGLCTLWLAEPGGARLGLVIAAVVLAYAGAEFATVFTNAMMPSLVPETRLGRLSGVGWAAGYAGGLASLVIAAGLLVADWESGRTMLGLKPLLPLDALAHEGDRAVGPFSALWYVVFVLPLFLFTPDRAPRAPPEGSALRSGFRQLRETVVHVRRYAHIVRFLIARMLYADGLGAIFTFGGIYAGSIFGWTATELGLFGVVLTVAAGFGALIGGVLDDRLGARTVILAGLAGLIAASIGVLSVDGGHVLFAIETGEAPGGFLASTGERVYLAFAVGIGLVAGPVQASSRSYLARLAPAGMATEFFGLYAFSGKVTAFAAPLAVSAVTWASGSQRLGIAAIILFLAAGAALLLTVREPGGSRP